MKRAHRRTHLIVWLILAPVIAAVLYFALEQRPDAPMNDALPGIIIEEPR